jgi:hypothetical protein
VLVLPQAAVLEQADQRFCDGLLRDCRSVGRAAVKGSSGVPKMIGKKRRVELRGH